MRFFVLLKFSKFSSVFRGEGGSKSLEKKGQKAGGQSRAYNNQKIKNQNFKKSKFLNFSLDLIKVLRYCFRRKVAYL